MSCGNRPLAVVTGASGGIGRAICLRLATEGYNLVAQYLSRYDNAESLRAELEVLGAHCTLVACDLSEPNAIDAVDAVVGRTMQVTGSELTALVNSAALLLGPSFNDATQEQFDTFMAVNLRAPFFMTQRLSLRMPPGGAVVNLSSAGAHFSSPGDIVYSMGKAALESMSFHAAESLATRGIRINSVIPGFTDNGHALFSVPEARAHMSSHAIMGDIADPATVAEAVLFLLSDRSSRTTGSTLDVSGGSTLGVRVRSADKISLRALQNRPITSKRLN